MWARQEKYTCARTHTLHTLTRARTKTQWTRARTRSRNHVGVQRLDALVAVLLARERMNSGELSCQCLTPLALMLAALPSRPLEMVADVLASREYAEVLRPKEAPVESDFEIVGAAGVVDSRRTVGAFPRSRRGLEAATSHSDCTVS
jgi:hypothetical protein